MSKIPTSEFYDALQVAFERFNIELFEGGLPQVLFTVQRKKSVMGYFAPDRWASKDGERCHEIALNPSYVASSCLIEMFQTLVHEMVHLWQECFGDPGRRGYHNKEWADKMIEVGLMPSSTGRQGGKKTGESMSDYPVVGGRFVGVCRELVGGGFSLPWVDRVVGREREVSGEVLEAFSEFEGEEVAALTSVVSDLYEGVSLQEEAEAVKKVKYKYVCSGCGVSVWGKPSLRIGCIDCDVEMECV